MANRNSHALARPANRAAAQQQVQVWEETDPVSPQTPQVPCDQTPVPQTQTVNP